MHQPWYAKSFRRNLVDMHIDGWNPEFLSQFDPQAYFECLRAAKIQSTMIYLQSHVGLCNWDSQSGRTHPAFIGDNKVRRLIDLCHGAGMDVVGYYSLIYNNVAYESHPEWRMLNARGYPSRNDSSMSFMQGGRYGLVCPNNMEYRAFVKAQFEEMLAAYPLEGVFLDMTFWPMVCYCPACRKRFADEVGGDIPRTVDWSDPAWCAFQKKREEWLNEFAFYTTGLLKQMQPGLTVEHQFSTMHQTWRFGVNEGVGRASDYAGGDLYGGHYQESFICKFYYEQTENQPFEYMTSRCDPGLRDHTTTKALEALKLHNYLTLAHHGACLFIDAIDPRGTLNPAVYDTLGIVFGESMPYEPFLKGRMVSDVAIYFNFESKMDVHAPARGAEAPELHNAQLDSTVGASMALFDRNYLYTVLSNSRQDRIFDKRVVIVSEAAFLSEEEVETFARYVEEGGALYISGSTDFRLAKRLLGLEFVGWTDENITYFSPTAAGQPYFGGQYTADYPLCYQGVMARVRNPQGHPVLATVTLPYTLPSDTTRFASIHSNPPGVKTDMPALVHGRVGKGQVIWSAAPFEVNPQKAHKAVFASLIDALYGLPPRIETTAPSFIEFTLFEDEEDGCLYLHCVNVQEHVPMVPVPDFSVKLRIDGPVSAVERLPGEEPVPFTREADGVSLTVRDVGIFSMYRIRR